jgi:NADH:ubiquinone reductase (H+-translocating)
MITLGHYKGIATLKGRELRGFVPWVMRRLYYVSQVPTLNRKARILLDWLVGFLFRREVVSLGSLEEPRRPLREAADDQDAA